MDYIITKAFLPFLADEVDDIDKLKNKEKIFKYKFRLYDGDGILYYEGLSRINNCFYPLDDFSWSSGCTEIRYFNPKKHKFEIL